MNVGIITAADRRNRQRFISRPLLVSGHNVCVLKTKPLFSYLFSLQRLLTKDKPDVLIFLGAGVMELITYVFAGLYRVPCVVRLGGDRVRDLDSVIKSFWQSGSYYVWFKLRITKYIARIFLKRMRWAILVNQSLIRRVENQLDKRCKIFIITQFSEGSMISKDYIITSPVKILTVTNFLFSEKSRGVIWLIEQLDSFVRRENVSVEFSVAGNGIHMEDVINYLRIASLSKLLTVELVGFVTNLDSYYAGSDIFLYHSFHDATPNVILESKRYGLPVLANDCEEFRELIEQDISGCLYNNELEFYDLLEKLINRKELRETVGHGAQQECLSKFSFRVIKEQIEASLVEVLKSSN